MPTQRMTEQYHSDFSRMFRGRAQDELREVLKQEKVPQDGEDALLSAILDELRAIRLEMQRQRWMPEAEMRAIMKKLESE